MIKKEWRFPMHSPTSSIESEGTRVSEMSYEFYVFTKQQIQIL